MKFEQIMLCIFLIAMYLLFWSGLGMIIFGGLNAFIGAAVSGICGFFWGIPWLRFMIFVLIGFFYVVACCLNP